MTVLYIMAMVAMLGATGLVMHMLFGNDYYEEAKRDY